MLKYPQDRYNGYVALTDGDGEYFLPEFNRFKCDSTEGFAMKYAGAFLVLAKRLDQLRYVGDNAEPWLVERTTP